jgi:hypothetical protein
MDYISNREISVIFWGIFFLIISLFNRSIRQSMINLIKLFFSIKIFIYFTISAIFLTVILFGLNYFIMIDSTVVKDAILWFIPNGLYATANSFKIKNVKEFFINHFAQNFKFVIIIEFLVSSYVFSLYTELITFPIIIFLILMNFFSERSETYRKIYDITNYLLVFITIFFISSATYKAFNDYHNFLSMKSLVYLSFPFVLMIFYLPISYLWILFAKYELLFTTISHVFKNIKKQDLGNKIKKEILKICVINIDLIEEIRTNKYFLWHSIENENDLKEFIFHLKNKIRSKDLNA